MNQLPIEIQIKIFNYLPYLTRLQLFNGIYYGPDYQCFLQEFPAANLNQLSISLVDDDVKKNYTIFDEFKYFNCLPFPHTELFQQYFKVVDSQVVGFKYPNLNIDISYNLLGEIISFPYLKGNFKLNLRILDKRITNEPCDLSDLPPNCFSVMLTNSLNDDYHFDIHSPYAKGVNVSKISLSITSLKLRNINQYPIETLSYLTDLEISGSILSHSQELSNSLLKSLKCDCGFVPLISNSNIFKTLTKLKITSFNLDDVLQNNGEDILIQLMNLKELSVSISRSTLEQLNKLKLPNVYSLDLSIKHDLINYAFPESLSKLVLKCSVIVYDKFPCFPLNLIDLRLICNSMKIPARQLKSLRMLSSRSHIDEIPLTVEVLEFDSIFPLKRIDHFLCLKSLSLAYLTLNAPLILPDNLLSLDILDCTNVDIIFNDRLRSFKWTSSTMDDEEFRRKLQPRHLPNSLLFLDIMVSGANLSLIFYDIPKNLIGIQIWAVLCPKGLPYLPKLKFLNVTADFFNFYNNSLNLNQLDYLAIHCLYLPLGLIENFPLKLESLICHADLLNIEINGYYKAKSDQFVLDLRQSSLKHFVAPHYLGTIKVILPPTIKVLDLSNADDIFHNFDFTNVVDCTVVTFIWAESGDVDPKRVKFIYK